MRNTLFTSLSKEIIFAIVFAVIALVSLSLFLFPKNTEKKITQKVAGTSTVISPTLQTPSPTKKQVMPSPTNSQDPTKEEQGIETKTIQVTIVVTPTPQLQIEKATISVTIDGVSPFTVSLDKGKTQCDVLSQALSDTKITQLLMKYDSSLDSYGVYQINNLGKDNAVWWTYTVNGKSPTQGCNHIAANNGDTVKWTYIGSR